MKDEMFEFNRNALLGNINGQPLCSEYKSAWRQCGDNKEMLIRLALMQQSQPYFSTACYNHLGLSKEYLVENFGEFINGNRTFEDVEGVKGYTYQMYIGFESDFKAVADVTSMMWCDNPQVEIEATKCPLFYVSNSSNVSFVCNGFNLPKIYLFDDSQVTIEDLDEDSEVVVYKYSDKAKVETGKYCLGKVKQFNKELRL